MTAQGLVLVNSILLFKKEKKKINDVHNEGPRPDRAVGVNVLMRKGYSSLLMGLAALSFTNSSGI